MQYKKTPTDDTRNPEFGELPPPSSTNPNQENIDAAKDLSKGGFIVVAGRALDLSDPTQRTINIVAVNGQLSTHNLLLTP